MLIKKHVYYLKIMYSDAALNKIKIKSTILYFKKLIKTHNKG